MLFISGSTYSYTFQMNILVSSVLKQASVKGIIDIMKNKDDEESLKYTSVSVYLTKIVASRYLFCF